MSESHPFAEAGSNLQIDPTARVFGGQHISVGSNVRIDAFVILSAGPAGLAIGDHVHLAAGVNVFGRGGVVLEDFAGLSGGVRVFTSDDDYLGGALTGPTVPDKFRDLHTAPVHVGKHVIVGAGSVILPGVTLESGASVGALSLVSHDVPANMIVAGNPLRELGYRDGKKLADLERQLRKEEASE